MEKINIKKICTISLTSFLNLKTGLDHSCFLQCILCQLTTALVVTIPQKWELTNTCKSIKEEALSFFCIHSAFSTSVANKKHNSISQNEIGKL